MNRSASFSIMVLFTIFGVNCHLLAESAKAPEKDIAIHEEYITDEMFEQDLKEIWDTVKEDTKRSGLNLKQSANLFRAKVLRKLNERLKKDFSVRNLIFAHPEYVVKMSAKELEIEKSADLYMYRGQAHMELGIRGNPESYQKAINDFTNAIGIAPKYNDGEAYYLRAIVYGRVRYTASDSDRRELDLKTIKDFSESIKINPKNPFRYQARAGTYLQMKEYQLAANDLNKFFELNKDVRFGKRVSEGSICRKLVLKDIVVKGCEKKDFFGK